jgi:hypothetical protein
MRSLVRLSSALAALLLLGATCAKGSGDGLLSLRISADAGSPPAPASKLLLTGSPGGISRMYPGLVQIVPGTPVLFQFPGLPASDSLITFSVATYSDDGCQVGRNAQPITATIKAGAETGPIDVILVSAGPCLDAGTPDALTGGVDVASSRYDGAGGFVSTGNGGWGGAGIGGGGAGIGGGLGGAGTTTLPGGGAGGNAGAGVTTIPAGGSAGSTTGGGTSSGRGGNGGGLGGLTTTAGASAGTRTASGGIVVTGGSSARSGGIVVTGGTNVASGGVIATGGSSNGGTSNITCPTTMPTDGTPHSGNTQGTAAGLSWSLWANQMTSSASITTFSTPAFSARWNNNGDFLVRFGLDLGNTGKPLDQLGTIKADLSFVKNGSAGSYSYVGIYGWSQNPCVEWYIVDDRWGTMPFTPYDATQTGTATIDGEVYKLYRNVTSGTGGSRCGVSQWSQYWSVRQRARQCGTISISEHFSAWKSTGSNLGNLLEAKIFVEAGGGSGSIDFPIANVSTSP